MHRKKERNKQKIKQTKRNTLGEGGQKIHRKKQTNKQANNEADKHREVKRRKLRDNEKKKMKVILTDYFFLSRLVVTRLTNQAFE